MEANKVISGDIAYCVSRRDIIILDRVSEDGTEVMTTAGHRYPIEDVIAVRRPGYLRELMNEIQHLRRELHDMSLASVTVHGAVFMCSKPLFTALDKVFLENERMKGWTRSYQYRVENMQRDVDDALASRNSALELLDRLRGHVSALHRRLSDDSSTKEEAITIINEAVKI